MPIDARIPLQGNQPEPLINMFAKMQSMRGAQQENQLRQAQMGEYERKLQDQNALRSTLAGFTPGMPSDEQVAALQRGGFLSEAQSLAKSFSETAKDRREGEKAALEAEHSRIKIRGQMFGSVAANPTPENANSVITYLVNNKLADPAKADEIRAQIQANPTPENIRALAQQFQMMSLSAQEQLAKHYVSQNYGGGQRIVGVPANGIGPAEVVPGSDIKNTVSPDAIAREARLATAKIAEKPLTASQQQALRRAKAEDADKYSSANSTANELETIADKLLGNPGKKIKPHPGLGGITGLAGALPDMYGGDAKAARQQLETFKGKVKSLGRQLASVHGKLGNMAVQEWKMVSDAVEAIDPSAPNFDEQLRDVVRQARELSDRTQSRYEATYDEKLPSQQNAEARAMSGEDRQALDWANANPNDKRAAAIKQRLGM
jgi:hypothetical protein